MSIAFGIIYSNRQSLGDRSSDVQLSCSIVGDRPIPALAMPEVVARVRVDLDPVDVTDADDVRWLRLPVAGSAAAGREARSGDDAGADGPFAAGAR